MYPPCKIFVPEVQDWVTILDSKEFHMYFFIGKTPSDQMVILGNYEKRRNVAYENLKRQVYHDYGDRPSILVQVPNEAFETFRSMVNHHAVMGELRCFPGVGIDYFEAKERFEACQV